MKKVLLIVALLATSVCFAQTSKKFSYKLGFVTPLPVDLNSTSLQIGLGSTIGEVGYKVSEKITATGNLAYIRFVNSQDAKLSQIPLMVGAKYTINKQFYFGAAIGGAAYNKAGSGTNFIYSPYLGMQLNKISVDLRYMNTVKTESIRVIGFVFSYTL